MNKQIVAIILGIFLISLTSAFSICIDHTPPSPPSNLVLTASGNNIQLTWNPATDEPACSGIDYYDIYQGKDGGVLSLIANTSSTNYLDENLAYGTYEYIIHAWDLAGHQEGNGTGNSIVLKIGDGDGDNGGGGGGGGSDNLFSCGDWEECIDGTQIRICENIGRNLPNRTETRSCFPDFVPLSFESNETWGDGGNETNETQDTTGLFSRMTGGVIGFAKSRGGKTSLIFTFTILILGAGVIFLQRKGHLKLKKS